MFFVMVFCPLILMSLHVELFPLLPGWRLRVGAGCQPGHGAGVLRPGSHPDPPAGRTQVFRHPLLHRRTLHRTTGEDRNFIGGSCRVTLVVAFAVFPKIWEMARTYKWYFFIL